MPPTTLSVTSKLRSTRDIELALATDKAKYDIASFITDGDVRDQKIQKMQAEWRQLKETWDMLERGEHPVQQKLAKIELILSFMKITEDIVFHKEKVVREEYRDQTEIASFEVREATKLSEEYRRVIENLHDIIDGSSPDEPTGPNVFRYETATVTMGLREKAASFDKISPWLERHGGPDTLDFKTSQSDSVAVLLQEAGGCEGLEEKVKRADAVAPLLKERSVQDLETKVGQAESLSYLIGRYGVEGLKAKVAQAESVAALLERGDGVANEELAAVLNAVVSHAKDREVDLGFDIQGTVDAETLSLSNGAYKGKIAAAVEAVLTDDQQMIRGLWRALNRSTFFCEKTKEEGILLIKYMSRLCRTVVDARKAARELREEVRG